MSLETLKERFEKVNKIRISNYGRIDKAVFDIEDIGELLSSYENLKEIEKSHKEENGKLRVEFEKVYEDNLTLAHELEQYKLLEANIDKANKIIAENKFDEGLYGLLMQEKEKNKELEKYKTYYEDMEEVNKKFIAVDKIKAIVDEHIPKQSNIITGEMEYTPNANANSFLVQDILKLLEEK